MLSNEDRGALGVWCAGVNLAFFQRKSDPTMPKRAGVVSVYITHAHRSYNFQDFPGLRTPTPKWLGSTMKYERWNKAKNTFEHIDMAPEDFKLFLVAYDRVKAECEIEDRTAEMKLLGNNNYIYD
jgi:hypothetical protein